MINTTMKYTYNMYTCVNDNISSLLRYRSQLPVKINCKWKLILASRFSRHLPFFCKW